MKHNYFRTSYLLLLVASLLSLGVGARLSAQALMLAPAFALSVTVDCPDPGKDEISLGFQTMAEAAIGLDFFDEPAPGLPPDATEAFLAYINPAPDIGYFGLHFVDVRPLAYDITWEFTVHLPKNVDSGSLEWDVSQLLPGWTVIMRTQAGQEVNLLQQSTFVLSGNGRHDLTLHAEMIGDRVVKPGRFVNIKPGWNLLTPVLLDTQTRESAEAVADKVFGLHNRNFLNVEEYVLGRAYWVFNASGDTVAQWNVEVVDYEGRPLLREPGWNIIGAVEGESLAHAEAFAWQWLPEKHTFESTKDLTVGFGYWIHLPPENDP